jgi:hypothetical protein
VAALHAHCESLDRDPAEVEVTQLSTTLVGRDGAEVAALVERLRPRKRHAERYAASVNAGTVDDQIGRDATELFNYLTGFSNQKNYRKLMVAPVALREELNVLFDREIEHKRLGRPAHVIAKMNREYAVASLRERMGE